MNKQDTARRLMIMPLSYEVMLGILRGKIAIVDLWLPDHVTVLDVQTDWSYRTFNLILESAEFPPVIEGQKIPELPMLTLQAVEDRRNGRTNRR